MTERLVALSRAVPGGAVSVEQLLELPEAKREGHALLWDAPGDAARFAGVGVAGAVTAKGARRFAEVRERGAELLASIDGGGDAGPAPRLFGGFAFAPGSADAGAWSAFGDASFVLPRWRIASDGERSVLTLHAPASRASAARDELACVADALAAARTTVPPPPRATLAERVERMPEAAWRELVVAALDAIAAGDVAKVVAARRTDVRLARSLTAADVARRTRGRDRSSTRFLLERAGAWFAGLTPERLVSLAGAEVTTEALAGSYARAGGDDARETAALLASEKDLREHAHVVDAILGALGPFCRRVDVERPPRARTLPRVHHLWSPIRAELARPAHVLDLVEALHPTPAVCGTPRERAARFIATKEPPRGWYAAPVGWFDREGSGTFAVAIRSARGQGASAAVFAGAGIVAGSSPEREYAETAVKERTMLETLGVVA